MDPARAEEDPVPYLQEEDEDAAWGDWSDEEEADRFRGIFDDAVSASIDAFLDHEKTANGVDLVALRDKLSLDQVGMIRLINYLRSSAAAAARGEPSADPRPALAALLARPGPASAAEIAFLSDDAFLQPTLADDAVLFHDWEGDEEEGEEEGVVTRVVERAVEGAGGAVVEESAVVSSSETDAVAALEAENAQLRAAIAGLREIAFSDGAAGVAGRRAALAPSGGARQASAPAPSGAAKQASAPAPSGAAKKACASAAASIDDSYFSSYASMHIHRAMLGDAPRTDAYQFALEGNPSLVRGADVLDVGTGTGILALFAARAGARRAVGVDASAGMAALAAAHARENGLDATAAFVASKVEDLGVAQLGFDGGNSKPTVLVSEWMGYALLFESMLDSVLVARDALLAPGGAVLPDLASMAVAGVGAWADDATFWRDVRGFSMRAAAEREAEDEKGRALVRTVPAAALVTSEAHLATLDLATMKPEDQDFTATVVLRKRDDGAAPDASSSAATVAGSAAASPSSASGPTAASPPRSASSAPAVLHALAVWFDVSFSERFCRERPVTLSTAPSAPHTHWEQTLLPLDAPIALEGPGAPPFVAARLSFARDADKHRRLNVALQIAPAVEEHDDPETLLQGPNVQTKLYCMGVRSQDEA